MIYLLKFGASFLLPPGVFFVCFWALAIYLWRKDKKTATRKAAAAVFFGNNPVLPFVHSLCI